ncbi:MAG: hypothetical protein IKJ74_03235 [Clostridia bacterium]|nr:hypothetical protein [Clostridia bacterium]
MKFQHKLYQLTVWLLAVAAVAAVVLRLFTYWTELEGATGFFAGNGTACFIYNVLGFAVFALCLLFSMNKGGSLLSDTPAQAEENSEDRLLAQSEEDFFEEMNPSAPSAKDPLPFFSGAVSTWQGTLSAFATFLPGFGFLAYSLSFFATGQTSDPYNMVFALLSALSGLYFIVLARSNSVEKSRGKAFFALIPALWCTVRLVVEYRDLARFVNKSLYIGQFLFVISALLFFLYQAQLFLGEKPFDRPNSYAFSALAVAFFGITCRLPQLIAVFGDKAAVDLVAASSLVIDLAITLLALIKARTVWLTARKYL